jgi:hypothetical protein
MTLTAQIQIPYVHRQGFGINHAQKKMRTAGRDMRERERERERERGCRGRGLIKLDTDKCPSKCSCHMFEWGLFFFHLIFS